MCFAVFTGGIEKKNEINTGYHRTFFNFCG